MFIYPKVLILLSIVPMIAGLMIWHSKRRQVKLTMLGDKELIYQMASHISPVRRLAKSTLLLLSIASVIVALARPVWGIHEDFIDVEGIALMVVLDVSASMNAQDIFPSRLERAKLTTRTLFEQREGDLLGLVLFAGTAFVQFPLTTDTNSAVTFVNAANTNSITHQGTALEAALRLAIRSFDKRIVSHSVVVLMTDGENHEGFPLIAAQDAADEGIVVHVIGFGSPDGAPIPLLNEDQLVVGYKTDAAGNVIVTHLDEVTLQEIARITGGTYQRASDSGIELVNLLQEIESIQTGILERQLQTRRVERFPLFIAIAVAMYVVDLFIRETKATR